MPKRRYDGRGGGRKAKSRRRSLYLVMNDDAPGRRYAIRKMDLPSDCDSDDEEQQQGAIVMAEQRLPPAQIRLKSATCEFFAAIGTKIMVTHTEWPERAVPVFDVRTRLLTVGTRPMTRPSDPIYVPVGDKLLAVDNGCSELLYPPPPEQSFWEEEWLWCCLPKPPFKRNGVASHAEHPDGRTVFVSAKRKASAATFAIDTGARGDARWVRRGKWKLPFAGRAHFDRGLDAWVGLSGDPASLGYLCCCDVPSIDDESSSSSRRSPAWKLSKEKLFCEDPAEEHIGANLVYMGGRSKFCLVQCFSIGDNDDDELEEDELPRLRDHMLRLTTFTLKYDKNGDLVDTNRQIRCFKLTGGASFLDDSLRNPVAFWM